MSGYRIISSDNHVFEPADLWTTRAEHQFRDRTPRIVREADGDWWYCDNHRVIGMGAGAQTGMRFGQSDQLRRTTTFDHVRPGGYIPEEHVKDMDTDGVDVSIVYPTVGLLLYSVPDSALLTATFRTYNDWLAEFCNASPARLKGIAMLNVDDVEEAAQELERCAKLGLVGAFIPVAPLPDRPYRHPIYDRLWWTAQDLGLPLLLHIGTPRGGVPGCEFTMNLGELTGAGRSTTDYWVRYSLGAMLFAGVFDRYPKLRVGSVEHEAAWIPHWLKQMDFTYRERPVFTKGWRSRDGLLPSDYWRRNMFVEFMEDDLGVQLRDAIGVETMLWGSDFPHAESTWPKSRDFLDRMFAGVPESDLHRITSENAARLFGFDLN